MFDAPIEDWYVWLGVAAISVAVLAVAVSLPSAAPPKATAVADAVDRVATSPPGSTATHSIRAEAMKLDQTRVSLRGAGGTTHAAIAYGPTVPVQTGDRLATVLTGTDPETVFETPAVLDRAAERAQDRTPTWQPAPETIRIRRVNWEGVDVVLVG